MTKQAVTLSRAAVEAGAEALAGLGDLPDGQRERLSEAVLRAALPVLAPGGEDPALSPAEAAAANTDLHMATCPIPAAMCVACVEELKSIRRHLTAAGPLLQQDARVDVLRELRAAGRLLPKPEEAAGADRPSRGEGTAGDGQ